MCGMCVEPVIGPCGLFAGKLSQKRNAMIVTNFEPLIPSLRMRGFSSCKRGCGEDLGDTHARLEASCSRRPITYPFCLFVPPIAQGGKVEERSTHHPSRHDQQLFLYDGVFSETSHPEFHLVSHARSLAHVPCSPPHSTIIFITFVGLWAWWLHAAL